MRGPLVRATCSCAAQATFTRAVVGDLWSPRSDSNRRASDYESVSDCPAGSLLGRSSCSGQPARLCSAVLTRHVTAGGMTSGMTAGSFGRSIPPSVEGDLTIVLGGSLPPDAIVPLQTRAVVGGVAEAVCMGGLARCWKAGAARGSVGGRWTCWSAPLCWASWPACWPRRRPAAASCWWRARPASASRRWSGGSPSGSRRMPGSCWGPVTRCSRPGRWGRCTTSPARPAAGWPGCSPPGTRGRPCSPRSWTSWTRDAGPRWWWWWWRTPTGRTRRPWTCWCSWAGGWSGPGRCCWSPTATTS
jgi:hypothetical protein